VQHIIDLYRKLGVRELAEEEARKYHLLALNCLNGINANEEKKQVIKQYAESLLVRQS
jgi:geranylgeranyl pyrophosphate synthase